MECIHVSFQHPLMFQHSVTSHTLENTQSNISSLELKGKQQDNNTFFTFFYLLLKQIQTINSKPSNEAIHIWKTPGQFGRMQLVPTADWRKLKLELSAFYRFLKHFYHSAIKQLLLACKRMIETYHCLL